MNDKTNPSPQTQTQTRIEATTANRHSGLARLVVIQGPELGRQYNLANQAMVLGRSSECDLKLASAGVSRRHCRIEWRDGRYWIEDLGSTNHTRINESVVDSQALRDGDRIRLGQTALKFIAADNPEAAWLDRVAEVDTQQHHGRLFDRHQFHARLEAELNAASANPDRSAGGVLYLLIDAASTIRDHVGMKGVDQLINRIGQRLSDALTGTHLLARHGEYSLAVLAADADQHALERLTETLRNQVTAGVFAVGDQEVAASVSIGVCPFSLRISDADTMLVCAARAAEQAQADGGNRSRTYTPEVSAASASDNEQHLLGLLREALQRNSLQTLYQPAVSTRNDDLLHYQLLPRLLTDDDQLIPAARFVPVAARHGAVQALDRWMSVRALAVIRERVTRSRPLRLLVSQSGKSLDDLRRFEVLGKDLESEIARQRLLVFEFALADLERELKAARQLLPKIRTLGFGVSVSGVGDDSQPERLLNHFQIDYVKLTRRFAEGAGSDPVVSQQFEHLAKAFHAAGTRIIVGQVEDAETMGRMWNSGADLLQGNFIQKPTQTPDFKLEDD